MLPAVSSLPLSLYLSPHTPLLLLSPRRGTRRPHQEDREGRDPDDDQRQSRGRVQRGGADRGEQEVRGDGGGGGGDDRLS